MLYVNSWKQNKITLATFPVPCHSFHHNRITRGIWMNKWMSECITYIHVCVPMNNMRNIPQNNFCHFCILLLLFCLLMGVDVNVMNVTYSCIYYYSSMFKVIARLYVHIFIYRYFVFKMSDNKILKSVIVWREGRK